MEKFSYTYSAPENQEVLRIRDKYLPREESKLEELKRLDSKVKRPANIFAYTFGAFSAIIMGAGMSLVMTELGALLGKFGLVIGIAIGLVGIVLVALAYPLYNHILKKERARIAPQILRLSEELLK